MKRFIRVLVTSLIVLSAAGSAFAAEGIVTYVKGKVEVQKNSTWVALNVGDTVSQSEVINTGFQSEAKIKLMDSVLYLGPVTRVTLDTLKSSDSADKVNVYLSSGAVRSKVTHSEDKRVSYTVRTAVAVASVRGTDWDIDCSGTVNCYEGGVAVALASSVPPAVSGSDAGVDGEAEGSDSFEDSEGLPSGAVIVGANQTVTVSENTPVSSAQNTAARLAASVYNSVSSAADRESVTDNLSAGSVAAEPYGFAGTELSQKNGSVVVEISVE